jgi:uncharacterized phage protein (TIGR01671 family)
MREIKFRVWDNELKTFPFIGFDILGETTVFDIVKQYSLEKITNNTLTIDQYTGLKDKNGVEIYENDICKVFIKTGGISERKEGFMYGVVKYIHNKFVIKAIKYEGGIVSVFGDGKIYGFLDYDFHDLSKIENIGNIHQNPELIK